MKKSFLVFFCFLLALNCVFATGAKEGGAAGGPIDLRFSWWGGTVRHEATLKAMDLFHELNPNITIHGEYGGFESYYQKLLTQFAGKSAPDIIMVDYQWVPDLIYQNAPLVNIYDIRDKINIDDIEIESIAGYCGTSDYLIGVPVGINGRGIVYNTEFFRKFGITPSNDWTWERLIQEGRKVVAQDPNSHLMFNGSNATAYFLKDFIKQKNGRDMISNDFVIDCSEQDIVEALTIVSELFTSGTFAPAEEQIQYYGTPPEQNPMWLNGVWGSTVTSLSNLPPVIQASQFDISTMRWIIRPGATESAITVAPTQLISVYGDSPYQNEVCAFIDWYLNSEEAIMITGDTRGIPTNHRALAMLTEKGMIHPVYSTMLEQALTHPGSAEGAVVLNAELVNTMIDTIHAVGYKRATPQQAAAQLMADMRRILDQLKANR